MIPVLLYHSIPQRPNGDSLAVDYGRFLAHVSAIVASGRVPMTIPALADALRGARPLPSRPVAITFDDGYRDNLAAIDALCERGLPATLYLTTGVLGMGPILSARDLRLLAERSESIEIGAHSVTHPRLDELSEREIGIEVAGSKRCLEDVLGRQIDTFAYPYGAFDSVVRDLVIEAGYGSAAAVKNAVSHSLDDPFAIARWTVHKSTSVAQLRRVLDGEGVQRAWRGERIRTRGYRTVRRARRAFECRVAGR